MKRQEYTTKTGLKQYRPVMSMKALENRLTGLGSPGWCLACGTEVDGVEPDASKYTCDRCDQPKVYGLENLMVMGLVVVK